jgi:hypothetical protein
MNTVEIARRVSKVQWAWHIGRRALTRQATEPRRRGCQRRLVDSLLSPHPATSSDRQLPIPALHDSASRECNSEIKQLCRNIIESQKAEIAQMKAKLDQLHSVR